MRTAKVLNPDFFTTTPGYFCMLVASNKNQSVILCVWVVFVHQVHPIFWGSLNWRDDFTSFLIGTSSLGECCNGKTPRGGALRHTLGSYCRAGERLDSFDLHSLVERNAPSSGGLGDLQVLQTAAEGSAGGERCLVDSVWGGNKNHDNSVCFKPTGGKKNFEKKFLKRKKIIFKGDQ